MIRISTFIVLLATNSTFAKSCWDKEIFNFNVLWYWPFGCNQGRFKWMTAYINWRKKSDPKGVDYTGNVAQTKSHPRFGVRPCRPWNEMFGKKMPEDGKYHNFCRNPGGSQRAPFCWVKEGFPGPKFGFCDVPDCVSRHEHRFISNQFRSRPLLKWTCKWSL